MIRNSNYKMSGRGYVFREIRKGKTINEIFKQAHYQKLKWDILAYLCMHEEKLQRLVLKLKLLT